ncbi:MAG: hypothetical protein C6W57_13170 [Caldibacillus debilis]|nr:MAG: hypothetical protein C6W57_13170 [Caldibacillus debilis]
MPNVWKLQSGLCPVQCRAESRFFRAGESPSTSGGGSLPSIPFRHKIRHISDAGFFSDVPGSGRKIPEPFFCALFPGFFRTALPPFLNIFPRESKR